MHTRIRSWYINQHDSCNSLRFLLINAPSNNIFCIRNSYLHIFKSTRVNRTLKYARNSLPNLVSSFPLLFTSSFSCTWRAQENGTMKTTLMKKEKKKLFLGRRFLHRTKYAVLRSQWTKSCDRTWSFMTLNAIMLPICAFFLFFGCFFRLFFRCFFLHSR